MLRGRATTRLRLTVAGRGRDNDNTRRYTVNALGLAAIHYPTSVSRRRSALFGYFYTQSSVRSTLGCRDFWFHRHHGLHTDTHPILNFLRLGVAGFRSNGRELCPLQVETMDFTAPRPHHMHPKSVTDMSVTLCPPRLPPTVPTAHTRHTASIQHIDRYTAKTRPKTLHTRSSNGKCSLHVIRSGVHV